MRIRSPRRPLCAAALSLPMLLHGCGGGDPTASDSQRVFADAFVSPPRDAVVIEAQGGVIVPAYDAWLKLHSEGELVPRYAGEFRDIDCAEPRAFFEQVLGRDAPSPRDGDLRCRFYTNPRFGFENGRWLVEDRSDRRWYFRVWKVYAPEG